MVVRNICFVKLCLWFQPLHIIFVKSIKITNIEDSTEKQATHVRIVLGMTLNSEPSLTSGERIINPLAPEFYI